MASSSSLPSPTMSVECPGCGQQLEVRTEDAGRRGQCTSCGRVFRLGEPPSPSADSTAALSRPSSAQATQQRESPAEEPRQSALITFACSLCETRMTARVADVGKKVECPDCGRKNAIPKPPPPKAPVVPAAMLGDDLELWGVDESPTMPEAPSGALPKSQARLHPVECKLCQTLMYATDAQIGAKVKCPDCGSLTVVKRSEVRKPAGPIRMSPGPEYKIDAALAPPPRPAPVPVALRDAQMHESTRRTTVGPDGRLIVQKKPELEERPKRPAVPLVQGAWRMLVTEEIIARWLWISLIFGGAGWFLVDSINTPMQSVAAIAGIFLMLMAVALGVLWMTFAAPLFLAIISASSEGHDRLHEPPEWSPFDWIVEGAYLTVACIAAGWPPFLVWKFGGSLPVAAQIALGPVASLLIFPLAMLGALLESSPLGVVSPKLLPTLGRCAGPWLLFYLETFALAAATGVGAWALLQTSGWGLFVLPVLAMGAAIIYMRLLGRLAWWIDDLMPPPPEPEREYSRYRTEIAPQEEARRQANEAKQSNAPRS